MTATTTPLDAVRSGYAAFARDDGSVLLRGVNSATAALLVLALATPLAAQVHYDEHGPWNQRAGSGPDAEEPKALRIEYVFPGSPAAGKVEAGDLLVGAGGPIAELARAMEEAQGGQESLALTLRRGEDLVEVQLRVGTKYGSLSARCPHAMASASAAAHGSGRRIR